MSAVDLRRFGIPRPTSNKVPAITASFWGIKLLTTAMGEAASDWSVHTINPVVAVGIGGLLFAFALYLQLRSKTFSRQRYWFAVAMVGVFGTMVADVLHVGLGIPYGITSLACGATLAILFTAWYRIEGTLSIHSISTESRELFYWSSVVATFAFGTAIGDLTAITLHLGYAGSIVLFGVLISLPASYFAVTKRHEVLMFWTAYVLTRPLGASVADWIGVSKPRGGLDVGPGNVALVGVLAIIVLVFAMKEPSIS